MAKRFLGLDIGPHRTHLAVLDYEKGQLSRVQLLESHQEDLALQLAELREGLEGDFRIGDRLAAALPAKTAYVRHLEFPFRDSKKIAAALPFELGAQIPVAVENCATASQLESSGVEEPVQVTAAAVPKQVLQEVLDPTDAAGFPLHVLDLSPFAFVTGLGEQFSESLLVFSNDTETTVSLVKSGKLIDYRLLPGDTDLTDKDNLAYLQREIRSLLVKVEQRTATIYLAGKAAHDELAGQLAQPGQAVEQLSLQLAGEEIPQAFVSAAALALRAGTENGQKSFNFRQGAFALRGEWQKLKRALIITASLTILTVATLAGAALVNYQAKAGQVDALQQEMTEIYRQTFPGAATIVDVPLQMKSGLRDLRECSSLIGGAQPGVLTVLKTVSDLPDNLQVEIQEFSYGPEETRIAGHADSFDAVNRINEHLTASPLFESVQVADAKMALKGNQVNFRLLLNLAGEGSKQ